MSKRNNLIIFGISGVAFILFILFVYLPYSEKQDKLNRVTESYQHSSYLKDSVGHMPTFSGTDQEGNRITHTDLKNMVTIAGFFYSECDGYCPTTTKYLAAIQNALNDSIPFRIISFTLNPEIDSIGRLKHYAEMYGAKPDVWHFIRSDEDVINLGEQGFRTIVKDGNGSFEGHSDRFTLLDKEGNVRGWYRGSDSLQIQALIQDVNYLVFKSDTYNGKGH